jgi:hypothetical protein
MAEQERTAPTAEPDYPRGITFEQVWAAIMEDRKENDRLMKDLTIQMGGLHRSFGELAEHLVAPGIVSRFNELGYHFDSMVNMYSIQYFVPLMSLISPRKTC